MRWALHILLILLAPGARAEDCNFQTDGVRDCSPPHGSGSQQCNLDAKSPSGGSWSMCFITCSNGYIQSGDQCVLTTQTTSGSCCAPGSHVSGMCKLMDNDGNGLGTMGPDAGVPDCGGAIAAPGGPYCCLPGTSNGITCVVLDRSNGTTQNGSAAGKPDCPTTSSTSTSVSTAAAVASATGTLAADRMQGTAAGSGGSQKKAVEDSTEVISLGANQTATSGALFCAESANSLESDPALASTDARKCEESFASANAMRAMNAKLGNHAGFTPDDSILGQDGTKDILSDFEKRYGIAGDEYIRRMLGPGGGPKELSNMLGSSAEKFAKALEDGRNGAGAGAESGIAAGGGGAIDFGKRRARAGMREALRAKLAGAGAVKEEKVVVGLGRNVASSTLTPLENVFPAAAPSTVELTIFDIVHRKYREKFPMLIPYRMEKR